MKFTCDSCGAQYMIGDEKLGKRGVKVRCKKCSYVIILRPNGYQPSDKRNSSADLDTSSADMTPSGSSDMGLSKEFAALGFDDQQDAMKPMNVKVEVAKIETSSPDNGSPFQIGASGGSLDDVFAASLPRLDADEDGDELTSVDQQSPFDGAIPPSFDDEFDATRPGHEDLGSGDPHADHFNENGEDDSLQTRRLSYDPSRKEQKPVSMSFDDDNLSDKLKALEKNELQDMHASLDQSLGSADSNWGAKKKDPPPAPPRGKSAAQESKASKPNLATLSALAAAAEGNNSPLPPFVAPAAAAAPVAPNTVGPVHAPLHAAAHSNGDGILHEGPMLDNELKSAFDAMFSPAAAATPQFQEGNLAANTVQESAPAELFRSAYQSSGEADRRPTRVFDVEAMQQVQAEQDRARPASITNGKKKGEAEEWYVAINDEQVGPMTIAELRTKWDANEIAPGSLCWKQGMPDWTAIKNVAEMAVLGDMDERARTVVQRVEPNEDSLATDEPPTIAHPEEERKPARAASSDREDTDDSEPSWRPSAASALASLAAAELDPVGGKDSSFTDRGDVAVGRALPATSDALEKLLSGDSKTKSSPFGSAELSSSNIRPLPKRGDMTSVSLRDPVAPLARQKNFMVPAAIIGGFVLVAVVLFVVLKSGSPTPPAQQPPQQQMAAVLPQVPQQQVQQPAEQVPAQAVAQAEVKAPQPETATQTAPGIAEKAPEAKTEGKAEVKEEAKPAEVAKATKKGPREPKESRESKEPKEPRESKEDRPKKEPKVEKEELAVEEKPVSEEDELLGGNPKKKRLAVEAPSSDLPAQLEDSDILGELRKHKAAIQSCRQKQASANSSLEGTMTITFVIEGNGKTKRWEVKPDNFKTSVAGKCVLESVKTWTFPKFSGRPMPVDFPVRIGGK